VTALWQFRLAASWQRSTADRRFSIKVESQNAEPAPRLGMNRPVVDRPEPGSRQAL
jgi:hypothetical protein